MTTPTRPAAAAVGTAILLLVLTACGSGTASPPATSTPTSTTSPSSTTSTSTPTSPGGTMTSPLVPTTDVSDHGKPTPTLRVTGVVTEGVEPRCLVLTDQGTGETYQPMGGGLAVGDRVTVEGHEAKGVATTCMQGKPLRITRVVSREG
ncbi:hypothetical protein ACF3NS_05775 [Arsenicicoccus cauae]|uniref:hypothetical protein n=1 Tax=Arsenicicoccus cauae TaxID=2663847 RepID=UPI00259A7CC7|nr:hypothetical protein [uncultured Arsenicicoccus sp.]